MCICALNATALRQSHNNVSYFLFPALCSLNDNPCLHSLSSANSFKQSVQITTFTLYTFYFVTLCVNYLCVHTALQQPGGQALPY